MTSKTPCDQCTEPYDCAARGCFHVAFPARPQHTPGQAGFDYASAEIAAGRAEASSLWMLLSDEHERDDYMLRPTPWEGRGEYQAARHVDGRHLLVRMPDFRALPRAHLAKATGSTS